MTDRSERTPSAFRLNLEQQGKRAKELVKAARAGEAEALTRLAAHRASSTLGPLKLADAQFAIARELGFSTWSQLKSHIAVMDGEYAAMARPNAVLDGDLRTLHVRCGSDLQSTLLAAGFSGDFLEHGYPYCYGPVSEGQGCVEQRARHIVDTYFDEKTDAAYEGEVAAQYESERRLQQSVQYERIVIWSEYDPWDQFMQLRFLAHYASVPALPKLELINVDRFPGGQRFLGLGQLPAEALRLLWKTRLPATPSQLALGLAAWRALASADPRALAALMRRGTPDLPLLGPAIHRHLQQLPSLHNGLSLTEQLLLQRLSEGPYELVKLIGWLVLVGDRLPSTTDSQALSVVENMLHPDRQLVSITLRGEGPGKGPGLFATWRDTFELTELGRAVLRGDVDWMSLRPPARWVGGVHAGVRTPEWRWNEATREPVQI
jgi:hypothetical protein